MPRMASVPPTSEQVDRALRSAVGIVTRWALRRHLPPGLSLEDLQQEARVAVWRCRGRWDPRRASFTTYATRMALGHAQHCLRKAFPHLTRAEYEALARTPYLVYPRQVLALEGYTEEGHTLGDQIEDGAALQAFADCLLWEDVARLPYSQRRAVEWTFRDGLTQGQIAWRMGQSQMHVSQLLRRALAQLADWWGDPEQSGYSAPGDGPA